MKNVYAVVYGWKLTKKEIKRMRPHFNKFKIEKVYRGKSENDFNTTIIVWREL